MGVNLRFCNCRVAFSAAIKAMLYQLWENSDNADALRFLWFKNVNSNGKPDTYQMLVQFFGWKDSPYCANYTVRRTASARDRKCDRTVADCVNRSFYINDLVKSAETEKQEASVLQPLIELMQTGGFNFQQNFKVTRKKW